MTWNGPPRGDTRAYTCIVKYQCWSRPCHNCFVGLSIVSPSVSHLFCSLGVCPLSLPCADAGFALSCNCRDSFAEASWGRGATIAMVTRGCVGWKPAWRVSAHTVAFRNVSGLECPWKVYFYGYIYIEASKKAVMPRMVISTVLSRSLNQTPSYYTCV